MNNVHEQLFFSIIKNKYLWYRISHYLKSENTHKNELDQHIKNKKTNRNRNNNNSNNSNNSNKNNKININTLKWVKYEEYDCVESMILNGDIELIKDKIKSGSIEQLKFTSKSYRLIFKHIHFTQQQGDNGELFKSLFKFKREEMEKMFFVIDLAVDSRDFNKVLYLHEMDLNNNNNKQQSNNSDSNNTSKRGYASTSSIDLASRYGDIEIVKFLHENRNEGCTVNAMDLASSHGHINVVQFLHENRGEGCTKNAITMAVENEHLEIVQFLCKHRTEGFSLHSIECAKKKSNKQILSTLLAFQTLHGGCIGKKNKLFNLPIISNSDLIDSGSSIGSNSNINKTSYWSSFWKWDFSLTNTTTTTNSDEDDTTTTTTTTTPKTVRPLSLSLSEFEIVDTNV